MSAAESKAGFLSYGSQDAEVAKCGARGARAGGFLVKPYFTNSRTIC